MNSKIILNKQAGRTMLGVGAFLLTALTTQAQGIFLPNNGNNGRSNGFGQNYGVFGGANGMVAYPVGALTGGYGYSFYGVGGLISPGSHRRVFRLRSGQPFWELPLRLYGQWLWLQWLRL